MTLDQITAFVAVVEEGSFQGAARALHLSQPSISNAVKRLEEEFGLLLFSRESYRAELTAVGKSFYERAKGLLEVAGGVTDWGHILGQGQEPEVAVALADAAPFEFMIKILHSFFSDHPQTKLKIFCEGVRGALERLDQEKVAVSITPIAAEDRSRYDVFNLGQVSLVPVCSRDYPAAALARRATERDMWEYVQVIIRDTAESYDAKDFGVVSGAASSCTVNDHETKKKIILAGLGWGRLPDHLIQKELTSGKLVKFESTEIYTVTFPLYAARRRAVHGPVAGKLWDFITTSSVPDG